MKPLHIVIGALVAIALAGGGFAAGMTFARGTTGEATASASPTGAAGRGALGGAGAGRIGQASTTRLPLDLAWQARMTPRSLSPGCNPSSTSMVTAPSSNLTRQVPQVPTRHE